MFPLSPWPTNKTEAHGYQEGRSNHAQLSPIACHRRRGQKKHPAYAYQCCFRGRM